MKRMLVALAMCGALASCATEPTTVTIARAEYAYELTYNTAATSYLAAVKNGALTGTRKDQCRQLLTQAYQTVLAARAAEAVGDSPTVATKAAALASLLSQIAELSK